MCQCAAFDIPEQHDQSSRPGQRYRLSCLSSLILFGVVLLLTFRRVFFTGCLPLFRDSGNFFFPVWAYIVAQYRQGHLPLWNPYLNFGAPLAAENSCAAFYPGIVILMLPIPFSAAYLVFLIVHLCLAAWGIARLARRCGATPVAASLTTLSYPLSGYVLFQIYNPIFLISAAWLPWAIHALFDIFFERNRLTRQSTDNDHATKGNTIHSWLHFLPPVQARSAIRLGVFLALMILGGDPHTAYHCAVLAFATWIVLIFSALGRRSNGERNRQPLARVLRRGLLLIGAALVTLLLAAIQIIPTWTYTRLSERALLKPAASDSGNRLTERQDDKTAKSTEQNTLAEIARSRQVSQWQRVIYDFSTPAYRWIEFVWPEFGGRPLPWNTRWIGAIVSEGRWWTPSLYMGLLPFLLAILTMRFWPARRSFSSTGSDARYCESSQRNSPNMPPEAFRIWFSWVTVFSLVAALGWYGPAGVYGELWAWITGHSSNGTVSPPVGGLYWVVTQILPGYGLFRYPSKWLVLTTLGLSVLASLAIDHLDTKYLRRLTRLLILILAWATCFLLVALFASHLWEYASQYVPQDPVFGFFEPGRARWETVTGLVLLLALLLTWLCLVRWVPIRHLPIVIVLLTGLDLVLHNSWMIFPVHVGKETQMALHSLPPFRSWQKWCDYPREWQTPSCTRIQELFDWERETSAIRWGMLTGRAPLESYGTLVPGDYFVFLAILHEYMNRQKLKIPPQETLALLGALTTDAFLESNQQEKTSRPDSPTARESHYCFLTHNVTKFPSELSARLNVWQKTEWVFFPNGRPRGPLDTFVVESIEPCGLAILEQIPPKAAQTQERTTKEDCHVKAFQPGKVVIYASLQEPGIVVLREQFMPGWRVHVVSQDGSTSWDARPLRINRIMMGVALPPGKWQITWTYYDSGFFLGMALSAVAWLGIALMVVLPYLMRISRRLLCQRQGSR